MRRLLNPLLTACLSTVVLTSTVLTTAQASEPVVVSSKIDTEGSVLGELIIQTLERHGIATQGRLQLGATSVGRNALLAAEIDVYPEYTGNGAFFFDMTDSPVWNSADDAYHTVRERDAEQGLIWLQPASANNTWAMSIRQDVAETHGLDTLEDLASYLAEGGEFKFAASAEFVRVER